MEANNMTEPTEETEKRIIDYLKQHKSCNLKELRYDTGKSTRYDSVISIINKLEREGLVQRRVLSPRSWIIIWIGEK